MQTEFDFTLPKGFLDDAGTLHRHGTMRVPTGRDELILQRDRRVRDNPAYGVLVMFSRVVTQLGSLSALTPIQLEQLWLTDLVYCIDLFNDIAYPYEELSLSGES